jgi:hypothetical protein
MTRDEEIKLLGDTHLEYREVMCDFGKIKQSRAELVSELKKLLSAVEREPLRVFVSRGPQGALQTAMNSPDARYFYTAALADRLTLDAMEDHLNKYRTILERTEHLRISLIDQGENDPGPAESIRHFQHCSLGREVGGSGRQT